MSLSLEPARARVLGLLHAAESECANGEWDSARVKYLALLELPPAARKRLLSPAQLNYITERLARPEMLSVGLCCKVRTSDGKTTWSFNDVKELEHAAPKAGVQTDKRSVCPLVLTPDKVLDSALQLANVTAADVVADLGCGDGRLLVRAAQRGARAVGFDVNPWCLERSRAAAEDAHCSDRI